MKKRQQDLRIQKRIDKRNQRIEDNRLSNLSSSAAIPLLFSEGANLPKEGDSGMFPDVLPQTGTSLMLPNSNSNIPMVAVAKFRIYGEAARLYYHDLHVQKGHPSLKTMINAIRGNKPAWKNCLLTEGQIRRFYHEPSCPYCILTKTNKRTPINVPDPPDFDSSEGVGVHRSSHALPGEILSMDPVGIINPAASNGHKYFWLIKDVATGYDWVFTSLD